MSVKWKKVKQKILFITAGFLLLGFQGALSQDVRQISLDECIKLGLENSKTIKISDSKVQAARAKVAEVNTAMYPSLKFAGGYTRLSSIDPFYMDFGLMAKSLHLPIPDTTNLKFLFSPTILDNTQARISLTQPIFTGFRLKSNTEMNDYNLRAGEEDLQKDKTQLIYDIKNAYWTYYKGLTTLKTLDDNITQMKAHLADIESMAKGGLATDNDVLKVKVQLSNLEYSKLDAESNLEVGVMALNNLIGLPINTRLDVKDKIQESEIEIPNLYKAQEDALSARSELRGMEYRIKAGEAGVSMAESAWYPQIFFSANYLYANPNQRIFPSKQEFDGTWDVGITFSYDLWNWGAAKYQTQQAEQSVEQAKLGMSQLKEAIQLEVSQSYLSLAKAKQKLPVAKQGIEQAEENYRVTREKFKSGLATNTDVLDAETALNTAQINYTTALVDLELAKAKLEKAVGK